MVTKLDILSSKNECAEYYSLFLLVFNLWFCVAWVLQGLMLRIILWCGLVGAPCVISFDWGGCVRVMPNLRWFGVLLHGAAGEAHKKRPACIRSLFSLVVSFDPPRGSVTWMLIWIYQAITECCGYFGAAREAWQFF